MNRVIKEKWIKSIEDFSKKPSYMRLLFPMKLCSSSGELFSVLGLLCQIHIDETASKWDTNKVVQEDEPDEEEDSSKKKKKKFDNSNMLDNITGYKGSFLVPPTEVLKWAEISSTFCSTIARIADEKGFEGVVGYLKEIL